MKALVIFCSLLVACSSHVLGGHHRHRAARHRQHRPVFGQRVRTGRDGLGHDHDHHHQAEARQAPTSYLPGADYDYDDQVEPRDDLAGYGEDDLAGYGSGDSQAEERDLAGYEEEELSGYGSGDGDQAAYEESQDQYGDNQEQEGRDGQGQYENDQGQYNDEQKQYESD